MKEYKKTINIVNEDGTIDSITLITEKPYEIAVKVGDKITKLEDESDIEEYNTGGGTEHSGDSQSEQQPGEQE